MWQGGGGAIKYCADWEGTLRPKSEAGSSTTQFTQSLIQGNVLPRGGQQAGIKGPCSSFVQSPDGSTDLLEQGDVPEPSWWVQGSDILTDLVAPSVRGWWVRFSTSDPNKPSSIRVRAHITSEGLGTCFRGRSVHGHEQDGGPEAESVRSALLQYTTAFTRNSCSS